MGWDEVGELTAEVEELEGVRGVLLEVVRGEETNVGEIVRASTELRQIGEQLRKLRALIAAAEEDVGLATESDPAVVAEALLRDLPEICRCQPELGVQIRDRIIEILPLPVERSALVAGRGE